MKKRNTRVTATEEQYSEHRVMVNGLRLHYADWGNPQLPLMLLTHGSVANAAFWNLVAPAFRDEYHVVAVTARGRGKSDYSPEGKYDVEDYVQDFREFTVKFGMDRITYVGQSLGGVIGMSYAARYPEQIERLILVDIGGETTSSPNPIAERPEVFDSLAEVEAWLRKFDRFTRLPDAAMQIVLQTGFHQLANEQWTSAMAQGLQQPRAGTPWNGWDVLPAISCPTLLIHGTLSDVLSAEAAVRTRDAVPDCRLVEMETGHLAHLEDPVKFVRLVQEFLAARA
jgi:esterase